MYCLIVKSTFEIKIFNENNKLFYLVSKGLTEDMAKELLIMGFINDFKKELPMEYAVELNRLIKEN